MTGKIGIWIVLIWGIASLLTFLYSRHVVRKTFQTAQNQILKESKILQLYKTYKNDVIQSLQGLYLNNDGYVTIISFPNVSLSTAPMFINLSLHTHNSNKLTTTASSEHTKVLGIIAQSNNYLPNFDILKDLPMPLDISYTGITISSKGTTTNTTNTNTTSTMRETLIILTICNQLEMTLITLKYLKHSLIVADLLIVDDHRYIRIHSHTSYIYTHMCLYIIYIFLCSYMPHIFTIFMYNI